jgi:leucyl-tRNA synthetase
MADLHLFDEQRVALEFGMYVGREFPTPAPAPSTKSKKDSKPARAAEEKGNAKSKPPAPAVSAAPAKGGFVRLEHIRANESEIQAKWDRENTFHGNPAYNADGSPKPKFMVTFPYPYMNGRLHLGHAFSLTKAEFCANYKRLRGHNVLFPFGFHCTGMPIQAAANKLKAEMAMYGNPPVMPVATDTGKKAAEKGKAAKGKVAAKAVSSSQWQTLVKMNIPEEEVAAFCDPIKWLEYFPNWGITDLKLLGASVDWRRSFITTSVNPYYNAFVEWQYRQLKNNDKIVFGKRAGVYSPRDGQVCADHDRSEGEGVGPQEYTLIKLRVKEPYPPALAKLNGKKVFLAPATLRPETMYGQTNCFVLPEGDYGCYQWANGDVMVMSKRSAIGLSHQSYKNVNFAVEWGKTDCLLEIKGSDLIGLPISAPRAAYDTLYVLPLMSISMGKGTGVVTSVPSDAPDDYVAMEELKAKPEYRKKLGLTDEMVLPFNTIPIINITVPAGDEEAWSSDQAAQYWSDKLGIKSTKDRVKLDEAKKKTYNNGFSYGRMLVGPYKGEKVSIAKPKEKMDMIEQGDALIYYEPEKYVESRSGEACIVAMTDQWYLKYGEEKWRDEVKKHVNDPTKFTPYSQDILDKFNFTLGWLQEWACSRLFGLGTQLPWDKKWVIESLSDSTIYMAYYTIAHMLQGENNLDGSKSNPSGIKPEQLNDDIFNYIYLRAPLPKTDIPTATLEKLRSEFEYWYPMDLRVSGKDLIGNHLTMALYSHASIWKDRPELWPRSYYANGHLNLNNDKMSKSTGNFLMLEEAIEKYSADATRYALGMSGDTLENANFETDSANAATNMLFIEEKFVIEMVAEMKANKFRQGDMLTLEAAVINEINGLIIETGNHFDRMMWRDGINAGSAQLKLLRDFYREWCGRMGLPMHQKVVELYLNTSIILIAPVCPHFSEKLWGLLGNSSSVLNAAWPVVAEFDGLASRKLRFLQKTVKNLRATCLKDKNKSPTKATILIGDKYCDWKVETLKFMQKLWKGSLPEKKDLMQALSAGLLVTPEMTKLKKDIMQFAAYVAEESVSLGRDALDTDIPFDQRDVLAESREYLSKHLINNVTIAEVEILNLSDPKAPDVKKPPEPGKPTIILA